MMKTVCVLLLTMLVVGCGNYHSPMGSTMTVATLSPPSASAGGGPFMLTVNGGGFASNSIIYFSGTPETTTFVSATQLTATIPMGAIATSGMKPVYVHT